MQGYVYLTFTNARVLCLTYRRVQLTSSIKENPRLRAAAEELRKAGIKVGDAVGEALRTMEESELMRAVRVVAFPFSSRTHGTHDGRSLAPRLPCHQRSRRPPSQYATLPRTNRFRRRSRTRWMIAARRSTAASKRRRRVGDGGSSDWRRPEGTA